MRVLASVALIVAFSACGRGDPGAHDAAMADAGDAGDAAPATCEPPTTLPATCNGLENLCAKRYDEVVYPTTHNAFCTDADGFLLPNQERSVSRQLEDGVRALMLDTYSVDGEVLLCHGFCTPALGSTPLVDTLVAIREFLRCHPAEVVTIIFEAYATAAETAAAFEASGAIDYVRAQPLDSPWPTLAEMIATGERLVVFTDTGGGELDWYHGVWDYARETPYAASQPSELACSGGRGPMSAGLLIFNHFLTSVTGSPELANMVNYDPYLSDRIATCEAELAQEANFVTVDFYEIGDVFAAVAAQNGATP